MKLNWSKVSLNIVTTESEKYHHGNRVHQIYNVSIFHFRFGYESYLWNILIPMLTQFARMNPILPNVFIKMTAAQRNTPENINIVRLYL